MIKRIILQSNHSYVEDFEGKRLNMCVPTEDWQQCHCSMSQSLTGAGSFNTPN